MTKEKVSLELIRSIGSPLIQQNQQLLQQQILFGQARPQVQLLHGEQFVRQQPQQTSTFGVVRESPMMIIKHIQFLQYSSFLLMVQQDQQAQELLAIWANHQQHLMPTISPQHQAD